MKVKAYHKENPYSYTLGGFPTMELIKKKPGVVLIIYIHSRFHHKEQWEHICQAKGLAYAYDDRVIQRLSDKDNTYVVGVFHKYQSKLMNQNHLILYEPSDMGNMGTIMRTMLGFGFHDLAIIGNGCDKFHPKVIRASMGASFSLRIQDFESFEDYIRQFPDRVCYSFMLDENSSLLPDVIVPDKYSLAFGNEGSGLPAVFQKLAIPVKIPQTEEVDSLNITIAAGIGMYAFTHGNKPLDSEEALRKGVI